MFTDLNFFAEKTYKREKRRYLMIPTTSTTRRKRTASHDNQPAPFLIFLGQRGNKQKTITIRQIPPPRIQ